MGDFKTCDAAVNLFKVIYNNGGSMELGHAFAQLSHNSKDAVAAKYGKISKLVAKFPNHFTCSKGRSGRSNFVEVKLPVEFCPDAGKKPGCLNRDCHKLHICTHFILGTCTYGEKCRKPHCIGDRIDPHTQRVLRGAGVEFMLQKPDILLELLGKKIKEAEIQMTATSRDIPDTCKHYNHESDCSKGVACPFLHVCGHYITGDCKFAKCKREHSFKDPHNVKVLKAYNMHKLREMQILKILQGTDCKRSVSTSSLESIQTDTSSHHPASISLPRNTTSTGSPANKDQLDIGGFHLRGNCNYGDKCMNHPPELPSLWPGLLGKKIKEAEIQMTARSSHDTPDTCKHYNHESGCSKGVDCTFLHVCSHYITGDCKFAKLKGGCKREHSFKDPHNMKVLKAYNMHKLHEVHILNSLQGTVRKRSVSTSSSDSIQSDTSSHHPASISLPRNTKSTGSPANKDQLDICGFHLRGNCNYGDKCMNHHTELPYLWQYCHQYPPGSVQAAWEDVSDDLNIMIEEAFCDETRDSFPSTLGKSRYLIHFDEMTAKPREATNIDPLKLRRLSTVSSVVAPPGHIFSTKWCWYWKDEKNKWQSYDTPDDGHPASTASSEIFEKNFQEDMNGVHPFSTSHHKYTMYFGRWRQKNDIHQTQRPVRRRSKFVSKEDMIEIAKRKRPFGIKEASVADSENRLPPHWEPMDGSSGQDFKCVNLQTISDEYKKAEKLFEDTMTGHIHKIERVQNADLWMEYIQKKQRLTKKSGDGVLEERQLFHGTSSDIVDAICQQGFDWRMCGKHGTAYGKGSYFASTAVYSHKYATSGRPSATQMKQMFLAKVVVGSYAAGSSAYVRPPPKDASKPHGELYDSCVDNTANPALFVVFDNGQSYPEILITYSS